jgi:hypothetical protein
VWPAVSIAVLAALVCSGLVLAVSESGPQPPCEREPFPAYSGVDQKPATVFRERDDPGHDWAPPACTGWTTRGYSTLVATAGRFRAASGLDDIRRRIGAISEFEGVLYWSTTHQKWQPMIVDAYAVTGAAKGQRRKDFAPDEVSEGNVFYYQQTDNLSGKAMYRMHIIAASPDRLVFETENVSTMRYLLVPLFGPGDLQSIYFLDREPSKSNDVWRYYSLLRTGRNSSKLITGHEASSVNRAVAFYRYLAGVPTNMEPPAAR